MKKALFLHIQKTAGTSVQEMARRCYGSDGVCSHGDFAKLGVDGCARLPFVSGHFGYVFAAPLMADRYSFTFLRDPERRIVSFYSYCRKTPSDNNPIYEAAKTHDLEGFLAMADDPFFRDRLCDNMTWQLAQGWGSALAGTDARELPRFSDSELLSRAKSNIETFDYVGLVETFDADIAVVFSDLGAGSLPVLTANKSRAAKRAELTDGARRRLADLTRLDRELYETVLARRGRPTSFLRRQAARFAARLRG